MSGGPRAGAAAAPPSPAVAWHDAECGGYSADLGLWERLAAERGGPVLDLGAGTGRVALHLAARGHEIVAVDSDPELVAALRGRAAQRDLAVEARRGDARELELGRRFPLVIAPMQLLHMLGGRGGRARALARVAAHLAPRGAFATTILAEPLPPSGPAEPIPDVREVGDWVHSSLPLEVRVDAASLTIVRLRQLVAPGGELTEAVHELRVDRLPAATLRAEAAAAGLREIAAEPIAATDEHVGSLAMVMEPAATRGDGDG